MFSKKYFYMLIGNFLQKLVVTNPNRFQICHGSEQIILHSNLNLNSNRELLPDYSRVLCNWLGQIPNFLTALSKFYLIQTKINIKIGSYFLTTLGSYVTASVGLPEFSHLKSEGYFQESIFKCYYVT